MCVHSEDSICLCCYPWRPPPTPTLPPPPHGAVGVLVVKSDASISFRGLFCCRPAGRLHLSPLLFMSPLTTCSPHSSTFSQRPQSLLLSLLLFLLIPLHSSSPPLPSFPFSSSSNSLPLLPSPPLLPLHFTARYNTSIPFFLMSFLHLIIAQSVSAFDFFLFFLTLRGYKSY